MKLTFLIKLLLLATISARLKKTKEKSYTCMSLGFPEAEYNKLLAYFPQIGWHNSDKPKKLYTICLNSIGEFTLPLFDIHSNIKEIQLNTLHGLELLTDPRNYPDLYVIKITDGYIPIPKGEQYEVHSNMMFRVMTYNYLTYLELHYEKLLSDTTTAIDGAYDNLIERFKKDLARAHHLYAFTGVPSKYELFYEDGVEILNQNFKKKIDDAKKEIRNNARNNELIRSWSNTAVNCCRLVFNYYYIFPISFKSEINYEEF
jgi:hypothetical protein